MAVTASAELINTEVGGLIRIRGRYWENTYDTILTTPGAVRIPSFFMEGRPIGPFGANSRYDWDSKGNDRDYIEQSTRLNVRATFSNDVTAFIELKGYEIWGKNDFRSDYRTGADFSTDTVGDIDIFQGYIATKDTFGIPLQTKIGRQEFQIGKGWLVSSRQGIVDRSFDGIRFTYDVEPFLLDAFWSKLDENFATEEDGDVDLYTVSGTYSGIEGVDLSAYWFEIRDARSLNDTNFTWFPEMIENWVGVDDYDATTLHTFGLRANGKHGAWDFDAEAAYQTGDASTYGILFKPYLYGDDGAEFDSWAGDAEVGYTFDMSWSPRVYLGGAYFSGEDNRDLSFAEWLSPFDRPDASISFVRPLSAMSYSYILDQHKGMTNFHQFRAGVATKPAENIEATLEAGYYRVNEPFDLPRYTSFGGYRIPWTSSFPFLTQESDPELGVVTQLRVKYDYSEDLAVTFFWEHLFAGDGLDEGSFVYRNGLEFNGGTDTQDANYYAFDMALKF